MGYKMVRDRHRQQLEGVISGTWRDSPDPVSSLLKKLGEEYSELVENRDPAELYDIQDVLDELMMLLDPDGKHGEEHGFKAESMGFFQHHIEWHPLSRGDRTWRQYVGER